MTIVSNNFSLVLTSTIIAPRLMTLFGYDVDEGLQPEKAGVSERSDEDPREGDIMDEDDEV